MPYKFSIFNDSKMRFLFVGALNNLVAYAIYAACIHAGLFYAVALLISNIFAIFHSYLWNKYFTFKKREKSGAEAVRFLLVYIVIYAVVNLILFVRVDILKLNAYIAGIISMIIATVLSYIGHKRISFQYQSDLPGYVKTPL